MTSCTMIHCKGMNINKFENITHLWNDIYIYIYGKDLSIAFLVLIKSKSYVFYFEIN
jgi:hypothetical protein